MLCLTGAKFEQYFSVSTRSQRVLESLLELLERIHMLDCGGERSISYQGAQFLVSLPDFCAGGALRIQLMSQNPCKLRPR